MGISSVFKSCFQKPKPSTRKSGSATPLTLPTSTSAQPEPEPARPLLQGASSPLPAEPESVSLPSLQEKIWQQAYSNLRSEEPGLVKAFEKIILSELQPGTNTATSTNRIEVTSLQMQQLIQIGIDRTKKEISIKQGIDDGLQAVNAIRGIIDGAFRAAPEAAVIWATVSLGIDVLTNPVTEALKNRQGIQYVIGRTQWYWSLADLLLDENKSDRATAVLRDRLEKNIIELFQKLLLYQIRSICLYRRNQIVTVLRDALLIDDWAGKLADIKEAENSVQSDMDQYNTQESQIKMNELNNTTAALQTSLKSVYAEMQSQAERREDDKDKQCLADLYVTDPRTDKKTIEDKKGGLLKDSYKWILQHKDFRNFKNNEESQILWIKGNPGKGKTMLLCGIIDELESDPSISPYYFFCQATGGDRLNTATSVLRGLIYHLARCNPQLIKHVRTKYDYIGEKIFQNESAWHEVCEIATTMLKDPSLQKPILIVDALDECMVGRDHLLDFITKPSPAKWIVSSRNWVDIEGSLSDTDQKVRIHLELNQNSVSKAVESYIETKVDQLSKKKEYDQATKEGVLKHLKENSGGTFLWVALVCEQLSKPDVRQRHTLGKLASFPAGLDSLYERMMEEIDQSEDQQLCREIIATALVVYRPITLKELCALVKGLGKLADKEVKEVITSCSSLLSLHHDVVSFVHQSAKDYLLRKASGKILPRGVAHQHHMIFAPGHLIDEDSTSDPDPLAAIRYSCIFWIDHLHDLSATALSSENDRILVFFEKKYLYWLEALSLLHSIYTGVKGMGRLETYLQDKASKNLQDTVKDARRFLLSYTGVIEIAPLQVYASALIFSPTNSLIRRLFSHEEPSWVEPKPRVEANWDACLQTLEGHSSAVDSVAFSSDGRRLASGSWDKTVKIWDATSGACLRTLEGHSYGVTSVVFSNDGQRLASGSYDKTVKIWDATSGACLQTLEGHSSYVTSVVFSNDGQRLASGSYDKTVKVWDATSLVFSNDGQRLASGSWDKTVKVWDATSGACLQTLEGHSYGVTSVVFSNDGQRLASGSSDKTVKIWDATSGACLQTLEGHSDYVTSVVFSNDGQRLASGSRDGTVKIWDATSGACLQTLEGHSSYVTSVVFSNDGQRLASGYWDKTVKVWDATSGACLQTLEGHSNYVTSVVFSNDGQRLASGSWDKTVKIWDATSGACLQTLEGHSYSVTSVVFSNDGQRLASGSSDMTVKIWDATSGACLQTLEGHSNGVTSVVFSNDGQRLASGSEDNTIKIWDATSGACLRTLEGHSDYVKSVVFSNDRQRLASGSWDKTVKIWDATSGACLQTLEGHSYGVTSVVFSNNGQRLASGSSDNTVKIWDAASGACLQTLEGHSNYVTSAVFSNDEKRLASKPPGDQPSLYPKLYNYTLSTDTAWIMQHGQRKLWLPPPCRPTQFAASQTGVGFALSSNRIIVIGFRSSD
ncbi:Vegetative incompatibility protein HET-E-1 [Ceratocystis lukuohia]|uniref:Vegetative incompatibility protein HET-E-1 n=1 Tax=Ceratocystis lukuohia TaxID=2019550 RepID=A0ABR4MI72_9PEZI